jgi:hypothetical protein
MDAPLYHMFNGEEAEQNSVALLEGRLPMPDEIDYPTRSFLSHCRFHQGHSMTPLEVSTDDHIYFWSRNPENKGSEPHGLHNGHFKAGIYSPVVAQCDALVRHIPLTTGFVPDNWRHLMNFAIEKKPGEFRLTKMRTIQLMNSESQANYKKLGRLAMAYGEEHHLLADGQCGSRKNHQAIDLALSKRLVWDLLILQRRSAGWISNDAKSCFDRVVHWVAVVAMMRLAITWNALRMMFDTLATSTHRVRTGFGDSEASFRPPSLVPFQGCGQGNGAGPPIWVSVSSIIIQMMVALGFGFECLTAIDSKLVTAQCFCFVDDTDVIEAGDSVDQSGEDICSSVQKAASMWAGGISATGGAINPEKSFWWLLDFVWDSRNGRWKFRRKNQLLPDQTLQIPGLTGELEALRRLEPDEAEKTLGVMLAPLADQKAHITHLKGIAKKWAEQVRSGHLHKYDVIPLIKSTVMKSLEYPMVVSTLDAETWVSIMSPVLQVCLPKAGICRSFPRDMVLAPLKFQGLGIPHPFGTQVSKHIEVLLRHPSNRTKTGAYLEAAVQEHQLETGTSFGIFQQEYRNTAILASDTWIKRVWKELEGMDIYVAFDSPVLPLRCSGDALLVEVFMDLEVDQEELKWLNWCRMYLQVCTVSDIATADGRCIRQSAWLGERDGMHRSRYQWPRTVRPNRNRWALWQDTLTRSLLASDGPQRLLRQPLGPWYDPIEDWNWLVSPTHGVFHRHGQVWKHYSRLEGGRTSSRRFRLGSSMSLTMQRKRPHSDVEPASALAPSAPFWNKPLPEDVFRATLQPARSSDEVVLTGIGLAKRSLQPDSQPSLFAAWQAASAEVTEYFGWTPDEIEIEGDEGRLVEALLSGRLCVISDGSYKQNLGTAAVQLLPRKGGTDRIIVQCQTPGLPQDQSAYRSELIGLLAGIMVVDWLLQQWAPTLPSKPRVRIACDGFSALLNTFSDNRVTPQQAQFDLVSSLREALSHSKASWEPSHVYGHLDNATSFDCLSWWSQRNVEVDNWAVAYRHQLEMSNQLIAPNARFFTELAALYIGGVKQSRLDPEYIQELVALPALRKRWCKKLTVPPEAESETDWMSLDRAMRSLPAGVQRWTTKHVVGMCGVGKFKVRWGSETSAACPCCGEFEDHLHVPRCMAPSASAEWDRRTSALDQWLDSQVTDPAIKHAILLLLQGVRDPSLPSTRVVPGRLRSAFRSQQCIGYQGLLEGRLSCKWASLQEEYLQSRGSQRSPTLWVSRLSQQLILLGFQMWEHRNSVQHSEDNVQLRERSRLVNDGIHSQFDMGLTDLPKVVQRMLSVKRRTVLNKPLVDREEWLKLVRMERTAHRRALAPNAAFSIASFTRTTPPNYRFAEATPRNHPATSRVESRPSGSD